MSEADPNTRISAHLHHLAIQSSDPARLSAFYSRVLGFQFERRRNTFIGVARERCLIIEPGQDRTLAFAAYEVAQPQQLSAMRTRLQLAGLSTAGSPTEIFEDDAVCVRDPDGNTLVFGTVRSGAKSVLDADLLPARLQHIVVASRDCARMAEFYQRVLGFVLSDNVVDDEGAVRTSFLRCGSEHHDFAVFQATENGLDHHCYETTDWNVIRDWGDHFARCGVPIRWGPGRHGPGNNLFLFVHDADGNWVELSAELERVSADRIPGTWPHEQRTLNLWGQAPLRS
jgi:catechol 2,3-dioxygenase-like lactoylglutathione lyase family enzyme